MGRSGLEISGGGISWTDPAYTTCNHITAQPWCFLSPSLTSISTGNILAFFFRSRIISSSISGQ
ncbi:Protein of unknown function [Pyronema omphalodes CBS 100304]|uniref:Uncharacterized protein n=1 Tax=Pyronema omphalodes (strain CBS 100304) TaxID=1076935 RepID=U4LE79_PYROM|nr:Protein of unknown function [Pyronema omphalodes CBS 100304]